MKARMVIAIGLILLACAFLLHQQGGEGLSAEGHLGRPSPGPLPREKEYGGPRLFQEQVQTANTSAPGPSHTGQMENVPREQSPLKGAEQPGAEPEAEFIEPESEQEQIEEVPGNAEPFAVALANTNLEAALEWLSSLPDGEQKQGATREIAYEAARENPQTALELAAGLATSRERDDLIDHAVSQFASIDPRAAADWVLQIPQQSLRGRLLAAVATAAAEEHPAEAATLVATAIEDGEEQTRAAVAVIQRWVQTAPKDAAAWVKQFPQGPLRHAAAENLLVIWSLKDRQAAAAWLETLPESERAELRRGNG